MTRPRPDDASQTVLLCDEHPPRETSVRDEAEATVVELLPWSISILLHAALVVVAFWLIWVVMDQQAQEKMVVPALTLSPQPTMAMQSTAHDRSERPSAARPTRQVTKPDPTPSDVMTVDMRLNTIGVWGGASGSPMFQPTAKTGPGFGDGDFLDVDFGNARTIVFVVDASGSLLDTFPFVLTELQKSVSMLSEKQSFTIIFFQGEQALEVAVPRRGLKPATEDAKRRVRAWLAPEAGHVRPQGGTDPLPGLQLGLSYRPELLVLLSDNITGGGTGATIYEIDQQRLLAEIKRANVAGTTISTIQFLYPDPLESVPGMRGTLVQIAEQFGGDFKEVHAADLNLP